MRAFSKYVLIVFVVSAVVSAKATAQIKVSAQVDTSKDIYIGESFAYHIIIEGQNKAAEVDLASLAEYKPQSAGSRDYSQRSFSFINGKTTQTVNKRFVMSYSLTAGGAGQIMLPPVTVTLDGRSYKTNPVSVTVLKPGTSDKLYLEVTLSQEQCYVGQPVVMSVKFYRYANIRDYQFNIGALSSDAFYVEELDTSDGQAREYRVNHRGRDSVLLTFSKVLIPTYSGQIDIGTASVSADVAVGRVRSGDPFFDDFSLFGGRKKYKRFMARSRPLKLTVLSVPEQGKPAGFYGLVGRYTISAAAAPTKVNVGDPITLTIKIGGSKYLKPVQWPELEGLEELTGNF